MNSKSMYDGFRMVAIGVVVGCFLTTVAGYTVGAWLGLIVAVCLELGILVAIIKEMRDNNNREEE
jgi:integral membrane sensor domain MASE1